MVGRVFLLLCSLLVMVGCFSQTIVPAGDVSGTWTVTNSPYQVQGLIVVQDGQTLTVEPGVTIEFISTGRLRVKGRVIASGTSVDPILFTPSNIGSGWNSIFFDSVNVASDSSIFEHCTIEYGTGTGLMRIINFSKLRVEDCTLQNGQAFSGGCVYMANSDAIFKNNLITNNNSQTGGGAFVLGSGTPIFSGNTFSDNVAGDYGGAFRIVATSNAIFTGNTFFNNQAQTGGAFSMTSYCTLTVDGNTFDSNSSIYDGAVFWGGNEFLTVTNNTFTNNSAGGKAGVAFFQSYSDSYFSDNFYEGNSSNGGGGGGVFYITSNSELNFVRETFHNNIATSSGSAIRADNSTISIEKSSFTNHGGSATIVLAGNCIGKATNCLFANNQGLTVSVTSNSSATYTNTNFVHNAASPSVGVLSTTSGSNSTYINCLFDGNVGGSGFNNAFIEYNGWNASSASFINCNIEGGLSSIDIDGGPPPVYTDNIDADPLFIAPSAGAGALFDGLNADWQIGSASPCFNAGTPDTTGLLLPATDLAGGPRVILDTVDIGAYEVILEAAILASSDSTGVCDGDSTVLVVSSGGVQPITYQWQLNGVDVVGANADTLIVQGDAPNAGDYRCIVTNGYGADTSEVIVLTYFPSPTLNSLGSDFSICSGTETVLYGDSGPFNYNWNNGLSNTDSLVLSSAGSYFYSVIDTNFCKAQSDTITISEHALPIVNLVGDTLCVGDSLVLFAGAGFSNYNWNSGLSANDSITVSTTGDYYVSVTDGNGCVGKDTAHVLFSPLPVVDLGADQEICQGDSILFTPGNGFVSYDWNNGYASTSSIYASSPGDWFVQVTDANGCMNSDTVGLNLLYPSNGTDVVSACDLYTWMDGITYTSNNNSATFTLLNAVGCDSIVTLDLTILNSTTGTDVVTACESYTWIDGNTYTSSNNSAQWTLTNAQGCDSIITLNLTLNSASANVTSNDPELIADLGATTYQWLDCLNGSSVIPGATNNSFIPTANGEYAVVIEENGCLDTSACFVINNVGLTAIESENWKIYPNPTKGNVTLKFHDTPLNTMVEVTNPLGQILSKQEVNASEIDLILGEESGVYIVRVTFENWEELMSIVKL